MSSIFLRMMVNLSRPSQLAFPGKHIDYGESIHCTVSGAYDKYGP